MQKTKLFDLIIVGGGIVGLSLALALSPLDLRVALVEPRAFKPEKDDFDIRQIALCYGSALILEGIGVWSKIYPAATEIKHVHVSQANHLGSVRLNASDEKNSALGYVVELSKMHAILLDALKLTDTTFYCSYSVEKIELADKGVRVLISDGKTCQHLNASMAVAADGANSFIRQALNIIPEIHDYQQSAVVTNIGLKRDHHGIAYERFYANGPLALLPLGDRRMSLVWTQRSSDVESLLSLTDAEFLATLQKTFGYRLGRLLRVGKRQAFALKRIKNEQIVKGRVFFLGSAANHLHPVAGQGLNLALRDIATFCHIHSIHAGSCNDIGKMAELYTQKRAKDQQQTLFLTHGFVKVFSNEWAALSLLNSFALRRIERTPWVKKWLNNKMMGLDKPDGALYFGQSLNQSKRTEHVST